MISMAEIYCEVIEEIDRKCDGKEIDEQNRIMAENQKRLEKSIGWIDYSNATFDSIDVITKDGCIEVGTQTEAIMMSELLQIKALLLKKEK